MTQHFRKNNAHSSSRSFKCNKVKNKVSAITNPNVPSNQTPTCVYVIDEVKWPCLRLLPSLRKQLPSHRRLSRCCLISSRISGWILSRSSLKHTHMWQNKYQFNRNDSEILMMKHTHYGWRLEVILTHSLWLTQSQNLSITQTAQFHSQLLQRWRLHGQSSADLLSHHCHHLQTHMLGFHVLGGLSIDIYPFILYKLYTVLYNPHKHLYILVI